VLTTLLAQDAAYSAGRAVGALLLPLLGLVLLATGVAIRVRQRRATGQDTSRMSVWLIGIGTFLMLGGTSALALASAAT
jgi:hypothetical protein